MDQNKLAELNAMAQGGTSGLQQYQASQSGANDARSSALNQAAGFGAGTSFTSSAPLQAALSQTASQYSQPGADYMSTVSAQGPGLDAASAAAASNWQGQQSQNIQSQLATERARVTAQTQADQQSQQNKLAMLAAQNAGQTQQFQYQTDQIGLKNQAEALNPQRITGQALLGQAQTVGQGQNAADQQQAGSDFSTFQKGLFGAVQKGLTNAGGKTSQLQDEVNQIQARNDAEKNAGDMMPGDDTYLQQLQASLAQSQQQQAGNDQAAQRYGDRSQQASDLVPIQQQLAQQYAQQAQTDSYDLPKFQYQQAVAAGMNPQLAAGQYLANEDQTIYSKEMQAYNQQNVGDTQQARQASLDQRLQRQQDTADATKLGQEIGMDPTAILDARTGTGLPFDQIKQTITGKNWEEIQNLAKQANQIKMEQVKDGQGNVIKNPDGSDKTQPMIDQNGHSVIYDAQDFAAQLSIAQQKGDISGQDAAIAQYLFRHQFTTANQASAANTQYDPYAAQAFGATGVPY